MQLGRLTLAAALLALATGVVNSQQRTPIDLKRIGPEVGERVPDFNLPDQTGRLRTLQSVMGNRGAMLVFIRSADW